MPNVLCVTSCRCLCLENRVAWLESEIARLHAEKRAQQRVIERLMEQLPARSTAAD